MAKNDQGPSTENMTRKERRAAERASRKSGSGSPRSTKSSRSSGPSMMVISVAAVVIGLLAVAALVVASGGLGGDSAAVAQPDFDPPAEELRVGRSLGDPDAPVKIEAYEDPQCPACGLFTDRIEPLLISEFVADGTVFFTYRDFPFLGQESFDGAVAMRVAEEMDGKFWDYHDVIFFNQDGENQGAFAADRLADMAELVGLDREQFLAELDDPKYLEAVSAELSEGQDRGVNSTPTLFVNGEIMRGVPEWEALSAAIRAAAASSPEPTAAATSEPADTATPGPTVVATSEPAGIEVPGPDASVTPGPAGSALPEATGSAAPPTATGTSPSGG